MKKIWVMRHSVAQPKAEKDIGPELALSPEGVELAFRASEIFFRGVDFKDVYSSPLVRAYQTAIIFSLAIRKPFPAVNYKLYSRDRRWGHTQGMTIAKILETYPDLFQTAGTDLLAEISNLAGQIEDGEHLLCVSHAAMIESAAAEAVSDLKKTLFGTALISDLKECEGVVFFFNNSGFSGVEEKRF